MPRFHFPIVNGHRLEDPVGVELADTDAAREHARTIARHVASSTDHQKQRNVLAEDDQGDEVGKAAVKNR